MDFVHGGAIWSMNFLWSVLLSQLWVAQALLQSLALATQAMRKKQHEFCAWWGGLSCLLGFGLPSSFGSPRHRRHLWSWLRRL